MNYSDKVLYYGVWGIIIGVFLAFSEKISSYYIAPQILNFAEFVSRLHLVSPEFMVNLVNSILFVSNILSTALSSLPGAILATLFIRKILKTNSIKYCIVPSITSVIVIGGYGFYYAYKYSYRFTVESFATNLVTAFILISVFWIVFWVFNKIKLFNKSIQPDKKGT